MARTFVNEKGFKVIEISQRELIEKLAEFGALGICDYCGKPAAAGYYIPVLNSWYCSDCYKDWLKRAVYYHEDDPYESKNFEMYKRAFKI